MIDQERGEHPTASAAERNTYCPGSHSLCLVAPPRFDTPEQGRGILLHEVLSQSAPVNLSDFDEDEAWIIEQCVYIKQSIQAYFDFDEATIYVEKRLFYVDKKAKLRFSGRLDLLAIDEKHKSALIIDYKTGWKGATEADRNLQLRWQAVLAKRNYNITKAWVAIIQPLVRELPFSVAAYDFAALKRAELATLRTVASTEQPNASRVPGPAQCENCDAASICPEAHAVITRIPAFDFRHMKGSRAMMFIDACKTAKKIIATAEHYFSDILSRDETAFPGYKASTKIDTAVTDNIETFRRVKHLVEAQEFTNDVAKVSVTKLVDAVWRNTDLSKRKAKELIEELLGDLIEHKESTPFLRQVDAKADRKEIANKFESNYEET